MKLNLNASEEEQREELAKEDRKSLWKFLAGGIALLLVVGGIFALFYRDNQEAEAKQSADWQKMQTLAANGVPVSGNITTAWALTRGSVNLGYKVEYTFSVNKQSYKGEGELRSDPRSPFGEFNAIRVIYDPQDPSNNTTSTSVENFKEFGRTSNYAESSQSSSASFWESKLFIKVAVVTILGIFISGARFIYNLFANSIRGN